MTIKNIITIFFVLSLSLVSDAHTSRILQLEGDKLIGLPEEYSPAIFNWEKKILRVGDYQVDLNSFENVIPTQQEYEIHIQSSGFSPQSKHSPYIGINLKPKDRTFTYLIHFNLKNLELIKVTLDYRIKGERSISCVYHELKIRDYDLKQIKSRTRKIK